MKNSNISIKLDNISKTFYFNKNKSHIHTIKDWLFNLHIKSKKEKLEALQNINLKIYKGETIGIIGKNGSGKSTLLKIIAGIYKPNKNKVFKINGEVSTFLDLQAGFNENLSVKDNIYLNGVIFGIKYKNIKKIYNKILKFSNLEKFENVKLKFLSDGMRAKLAFSITIHSNLDILLIDEVLSVGDIEFQKKCEKIFKSYKKIKKTIILVSHNLDTIQNFCSKVLLLEKGKTIYYGDPKIAIEKYNKLN